MRTVIRIFQLHQIIKQLFHFLYRDLLVPFDGCLAGHRCHPVKNDIRCQLSAYLFQISKHFHKKLFDVHPENVRGNSTYSILSSAKMFNRIAQFFKLI